MWRYPYRSPTRPPGPLLISLQFTNSTHPRLPRIFAPIADVRATLRSLQRTRPREHTYTNAHGNRLHHQHAPGPHPLPSTAHPVHAPQLPHARAAEQREDDGEGASAQNRERRAIVLLDGEARAGDGVAQGVGADQVGGDVREEEGAGYTLEDGDEAGEAEDEEDGGEEEGEAESGMHGGGGGGRAFRWM